MPMTDWEDVAQEKRTALWGFAEELALAGGQITLEYFGQEIGVEWKADESPVTHADRETERSMRALIAERWPDHAIHGEEFGADEHTEFTWVLDPIDGTKSFINGVPLYCTLVALLYRETPVIGVILNPPSGESVSGCLKMGTRDAAGNPVRFAEPPAQLRIYTSDFADLAAAAPEWYPPLLQERVIARTWGDGYGYLLAASGRGDIMIDPEVELWDIAPMHPIISEAGGVLCDLDGNPTKLPRSAAAMSQGLYTRIFG